MLIQLIMASISVFLATDSFGSEYRSFVMDGFQSTSTLYASKGCSRIESTYFGIRTKVSFDCYGLLLRGVTGKDQLGAPRTEDAILLFPIGEKRSDVETLIQYLNAYTQNTLPTGFQVELSELQYIDREVDLSSISRDPKDAVKIKLGGIDLKIKTDQQYDEKGIPYNGSHHFGIE